MVHVPLPVCSPVTGERRVKTTSQIFKFSNLLDLNISNFGAFLLLMLIYYVSSHFTLPGVSTFFFVFVNKRPLRTIGRP